MNFFHHHDYIFTKSVALLPPIETDYERVKLIREVDDSTTYNLYNELSDALGRKSPFTSIIKQCACGALQDYIFQGDHTVDWKE